jgi:hypothetical protein
MLKVNGTDIGADVFQYLDGVSDPTTLNAAYTFTGGAENNSVSWNMFNTAASLLRNLSSPLSFNGGGGTDTISLYTQDAPGATSTTINTESNLFQMGGVSLTDVESVYMLNTFVDDTITVTRINGYKLELVDYNTFWGDWRTGTAAFVLDLRGTSKAETIQTDVRFSNLDLRAGNVVVKEFEDLKLFLGSGNDVVNLTLNFDPSAPIKFAADGGDGVDVLRLTSASSGSGVTLDATALSASAYSFKGFETFEFVSNVGNDSVTGGALNDVIRTGLGSDVLKGGGGNDSLDGGIEYDRGPVADSAIYTGKFSDYSFVRLTDGRVVVKDMRAGSPDGTDTTKNIELYQFADGERTNADVAAPIVRPTIAGTPKSILPDFQINTTQSSNARVDVAKGYDVTALGDGRFFVTWTSIKDATTDTDIKARIFNADGTAAGAEFAVNTTSARTQSAPDAVKLVNGTVMVAWQSDEGAKTGLDIRARIFDSNGVARGDDFVLNTISADAALVAKAQYTPDLSALKDGGVLATWQSQALFDGNYAHDPSGVVAQFFNANGSARGAEFALERASHQHFRNLSATELNDGRLLITEDSFDPALVTKSVIVARDGTLAPGYGNTNEDFREVQQLSAVTLSDGRIVQTFYAYRSTYDFNLGTNLIVAQIFAPDGTPENLAFVVGKGNESPSLTALTWTDYTEANSFDIRMRVYNTDGSEAGPDFVVNSTTAGRQTISNVVELADGRVAVTWESTDANEVSSIRATVIDLGNVKTDVPPPPPPPGGGTGDPPPPPPPGGGTGGDGQMTGTTTADTLTGNGAADTLLGLGGDDRLIGAGGTDMLRGGTGRDRLEGGDDADVLNGGRDNDTLWGGLGADMLKGGAGVDRYLYESAAEGVDTIAKFEKGEKIVFSGEAFGFGDFAGKLAVKHFKSGGKKAGDADDYFIFRQSDDTLWFDADGKGGAASIKIVDLANDFDLRASDILIV